MSDPADDSFREFFTGAQRELSRAAFFLTGDVHAAEELLQDALVRTAAHWDRIRRQGAPEAYVRKVMLNAVRSRWRRSRRVREYATPMLVDVPDPSDVAAEAAISDTLARCLRQLAPRQRAVLYLRFYLDLGEQETAESLDCSVGTVKSQTHDALKRLRAMAPQLLSSEWSDVHHD